MNYQKECVLCPRKCKANRAVSPGFCGAGTKAKVARASLHFWEEPCISGTRGSGAVFFSHCPLTCVYCQNREISHDGFGYEMSDKQLSEIFKTLEKQGAHNINLVTPTHFIPSVLNALDITKPHIPIVYNSSGYESSDIISPLAGYIDIFLPDFKYYDERFSKKYSAAPDYMQNAKAAINAMIKISGKPRFNDHGMMARGTIVRHMLLPGLLDDSKRIIKYLYRTYGDDIYISIMSQYTPVGALLQYPELARKTDRDDYAELIDYAMNLGVKNAYIQEGDSADESFIPPFDGTGIFS